MSFSLLATLRSLSATARRLLGSPAVIANNSGSITSRIESRGLDGDPYILLGYSADTNTPLRMSISELAKVHTLCEGSTGTGKTSQIVGLIAALISCLDRCAIVVDDFKNEVSQLFAQSLVPATLSRWPTRAVDSFFDAYRLINPFGDRLPPANILALEGDIPPGLHAYEASIHLAEALGADSLLGPRMKLILTKFMLLGVLLKVSILEVRAALQDPRYLTSLIPSIPDPDLRAWLLYAWPKESKEATIAVVSRLELLALVPDTFRMLAADEMLDVAPFIERGFTLITAPAPRGAEFLSRFWHGKFLTALSRAALSRPLSSDTLPAFFFADEFQEALQNAEHLNRVLAQSRWKKCSWTLINQHPEQIRAVSPELWATVANSCNAFYVFRQSAAHSSLFSALMPVSGSMRVPRTSASAAWDTRFATEDEERKIIAARIASLPNRTCYFVHRPNGEPAHVLRSPTILFADAERAAERAPRDIRDACERTFGRTRAELDRIIAIRRSHIADLVLGRAERPTPSFGANAPEMSFGGDLMAVEAAAYSLTPDSGPVAISPLRENIELSGDTKDEEEDLPFLG